MKIKEANIEIIRDNGTLSSISVVMPMWDKIGIDDFLSINIPLFGIKTFAKDEVDSDLAVEEAIKIFCINAEDFGKGLENELKILGWSFSEQTENSTSMYYGVSDTNIVLEQIMQTGEQYSQKLELV